MSHTLAKCISVVFGKEATLTTKDLRETFNGVFATSYLNCYLGNSEKYSTHSPNYVKRSEWIKNTSEGKRIYKHSN